MNTRPYIQTHDFETKDKNFKSWTFQCQFKSLSYGITQWIKRKIQSGIETSSFYFIT